MLTAILCVALLLIHAWLVYGHRHMMRASGGDQPRDQLFTPGRQRLAFGFLNLVLGAALYLRVRALPPPDLWLWLGTAVFLAGCAIRVWAVRTLGKLFTFEIGIRSGHRIVDSGPYRSVRHPSYTGYLLVLAGICVAYASPVCALLTLPGTVIFLVLRIREEERMLRSHFGPAYEEYMKRTKRLIPFLY